MASSPLHHAADSAAGALFSAIPDAEVRGVLKRCVDLVQAQPGRWPAMTVMLRPYFAADAADAAMGAGSSGFGHGAGVELRVDVSTSGDTQQQPVFTPEASVVRHNGHGADAAGGSRAYRRSLGMTPARMDREIDALAEQLDFGSGGEEEGKVEVGLWVARLLHRARARRCAARSGAFARRAFKGACELLCACAWV